MKFKMVDDDELTVSVFGRTNGSEFHDSYVVKKINLEKFLEKTHAAHDVVAHDNNHQKVYAGFGKKN